jgi:hypothetical protein
MSVEGSATKIKEFFKEKGVLKSTGGTIVHNGSRYNIPYDDFIYDLTHDFTHTTPNLTTGETTQGLRFLKKIRLPTSHIRSNRLRSRYTSLREGSSGDVGIPETPKSSSSDESRPPSRIPVRSAPQIIRSSSRGRSRFPTIYNRRNRPSDSHSSQLNTDIEKLLGK